MGVSGATLAASMNDQQEKVSVKVEVVAGPTARALAAEPGRAVVIGRERDCDLCLPDAGVSRRHAKIDWEGERPVIVDLESRHGTFVNSIRIEPNEPLPLRDGDSLEISPFTLLITLTGIEEEEDEPQTPHSSDRYATRATLFDRLKGDETTVREKSWQEFVEKYRPIILGFARNAGLSAGERDDVMQDVLMGFLRVHASFQYDPARGRFRGYLKRAVLSAIRARLRKKKSGSMSEDPESEGGDDHLDSMWSRQWTAAALEEALHEAEPMFEDRTWKAFELYGRRGVPCREVAEQLNMSEESVRHAKSRVSREVRKVLEKARSGASV